MKKKKIQINTANAILYLGSLYRNAADAIQAHISNAIHEHAQAQAEGRALPKCKVDFTIDLRKVRIEYPYGMSKDEFSLALERVANSAKKDLKDIRQIGQLGIGMFSFLQIGRKCTFISKKHENEEAFKVILREGQEDAEFSPARKRESPEGAGIIIEITDLKFDPTRSRGPLSPNKLTKFFAEKFDNYLRDGSLEITIACKGKVYNVQPLEIGLPRICKRYSKIKVAGDRSKVIGLELYFDPSGKGRVSVRHNGVVVIEDLGQIEAYGLEEGILAQGFVRGFIDADFLQPLPARTGFDENDDWLGLLNELDRLCPSIEAEVEELKRIEEEKKLTEIQKKAIRLARDILDSDELKDLELLEGLGRKGREYH